MLERFSVGVAYVSPVMFKDKSSALKILKDSIEHSGTLLKYTYAGDQFKTASDIAMEVLHPPPQGMPGRDNASSVVLSIKYADRRILLTGDLEPPGSQALMNELPCHCDVLLAPHHGSAYSVPDAMANWSTPNWVIIAGRSDDGRVARPVYEAHGATVLNTADCGAVTVTIGRGQFTVDCFRPQNVRGKQ
ncbi:MAG TPA: hypothetical protein VGJ15_06370 [Pirellulales bacterium]